MQTLNIDTSLLFVRRLVNSWLTLSKTFHGRQDIFAHYIIVHWAGFTDVFYSFHVRMFGRTPGKRHMQGPCACVTYDERFVAVTYAKFVVVV